MMSAAVVLWSDTLAGCSDGPAPLELSGAWVSNSGLIQSNGTKRPAMTWLLDFLGR